VWTKEGDGVGGEKATEKHDKEQNTLESTFNRRAPRLTRIGIGGWGKEKGKKLRKTKNLPSGRRGRAAGWVTRGCSLVRG